MTVRTAVRAAVVVGVALALCAGAACSSGPATLSADEVAAEVEPVATEAIGLDIEVLACDEVRVEAGETTTCRADLGEVGAAGVEAFDPLPQDRGDLVGLDFHLL